MKNSRRGGRTALAAALLVLAGCSDDAPQPKAAETSTPSATPTESATASPTSAPTLPPEAKGTSDKAAKAFVRYAVDVLNSGAVTLDADAITAISTSDCSGCNAITSRIEDLKNDGGDIDGGAWIIDQALVLRTGDNRHKQVAVAVRYGPQVVHERQGGKAIRHPAGKTTFNFSVVRASGSWRIADIEGVAS